MASNARYCQIQPQLSSSDHEPPTWEIMLLMAQKMAMAPTNFYDAIIASLKASIKQRLGAWYSPIIIFMVICMAAENIYSGFSRGIPPKSAAYLRGFLFNSLDIKSLEQFDQWLSWADERYPVINIVVTIFSTINYLRPAEKINGILAPIFVIAGWMKTLESAEAAAAAIG